MCVYCDKIFCEVRYLRAHMTRMHNKKQTIMCDRCRVIHHIFFAGHKAGYIMEEIPPFIIEESRAHCSMCDRLFSVLKRV